MTAGRVYGNTKVTVTGGQIRHNVYGGGALASVGTFTTDPTNDTITSWISGGKATVLVSGGIIGPSLNDLIKKADGSDCTQAEIDSAFKYLGSNEGSVYGSSRGEPGLVFSTKGFTKETSVTISGNAEVVSGVFGGGENGHVYGNTEVAISGGTIGGAPLHEGQNYIIPEGLFQGQKVNLAASDSETHEDEFGVGKTIYRGGVFGGGRGSDTYNDLTTTPPQFGIFSPTAGRVYGDTKVTVSGGKIYNTVYGGGTIASVGKYKYDATVTDSIVGVISGGNTEVVINGGQIGYLGRNEGNVFGGGLGVTAQPGDQLS